MPEQRPERWDRGVRVVAENLRKLSRPVKTAGSEVPLPVADVCDALGLGQPCLALFESLAIKDALGDVLDDPEQPVRPAVLADNVARAVAALGAPELP